MKKTEKNYMYLSAVFVVSLVIANVITGKVIDTGIPFMGETITVSGALFCYPVTYLITDIIGEIWGKESSNQLVKTGFISQSIATVIIILARYLPFVDAQMQDAYVMLLGQNGVFAAGSLAAYLISQNMDVFIFHKIRDKWIKKHGSRKGGRWLWNNVSTMTSQFVDTAVFITIAFGIGFGWLWDNPLRLIGMLIGQYLVKVFIAALDTPFFYFFTRENIKK